MIVLESYALLTNLDSSIIKLNPVLEPHGYVFFSVNIGDLEKDFADLFGFPVDIKTNDLVQAVKGPPGTPESSIPEDLSIYNSIEFINIFFNQRYTGFNVLQDRKIIMLKRAEDFELPDNCTPGTTHIFPRLINEMEAFVRSLVHQLRLLKNGDISCKVQFQIDAESRKIRQRYNPVFTEPGLVKLEITDEDVAAFAQSFNPDFSVNKLSELAFINFNASYCITDIRAKYLVLMMCLEVLFKESASKIAHTISKHVAAIFSNDKKTFAVKCVIGVPHFFVCRMIAGN